MQFSADQQTSIAAICRRYGIVRLRMFGSAAMNQERPDSDVDFLVEFTPGKAPGAFALVTLQDELSRVLGGRRVDLSFESILRNPFRRRAIEPQLREVYA